MVKGEIVRGNGKGEIEKQEEQGMWHVIQVRGIRECKTGIGGSRGGPGGPDPPFSTMDPPFSAMGPLF